MSYANYDDVVDQLRSAGLIFELPLQVATGPKSVRCLIEGGDSEKRGWYRLHEWVLDSGEVMLTGSFGNFQGDDAGTRKVELSKKCSACGAEMGMKEKSCPACRSKDVQKRGLTEEQKAALREKLAQDKKRAEFERKADIERAAQWAADVWRHCRELEPGGHDYLVRKKLAGTGGARLFESNDGLNLTGADADDYKYLAGFHGCLVIPMTNAAGKVHGLQFIDDRKLDSHKARIKSTSRDKNYWPKGLSKDAHYHQIGGTPGRVCLIAEGFATAMSLHNATNHTVIVAFDAGNLPKVAKAIKATYRKTKQLICADDDWLQKCAECGTYTPVATPVCQHCGKPHRKSNAGQQRAQEAALLVDGGWISPKFHAEKPVDRKGPTDFNDLHALEGISPVRTQIEAALTALGVEITPTPALSERSAGVTKEGGGERQQACAIMPVDDLVQRFIPLDDGTGDYVFDTWSNRIAKRSQMIALLPAGARADDIKRHPVWVTRGAYFMDQVGFDPSGKNERIKLNMWQGWPMKAAEGNCQTIIEHLYFLCSREENAEEAAEYLIDWLAYPLQYPGTKLASALIIHGDQGTGKSIIFDQVMSKIYGDTFKKVSQRRIENQFTDWARNRLMVLIEEISASSDIWHVKGEFKDLVTSDTVDINDKNEKWIEQINMINFVLLSNEQMPIPIERGDRRHLVIYTPQAPSKEYLSNLWHAISTKGEIAAFYHYLLNRDLSGFHPHKQPPMTQSKQRLINISLPSEAVFVNEWIDGQIEHNGNPVPLCPCLGSDLFAVYSAWAKRSNIARARDQSKFIGYISTIPAWEAGKSQPTYIDLNSSAKINRKMIVPSAEALAKAQSSAMQGENNVLPQTSNTSKGRWLTEGYFKFRQACGLGQ